MPVDNNRRKSSSTGAPSFLHLLDAMSYTLHFWLSLCLLSRVCVSVGNARVIGSRRRLPLTAAQPSTAHHVASSQSTPVFFYFILCPASLAAEAKSSSTPIRPIFPFGIGISFPFFPHFLSFPSVLRFGVSFVRLIFLVTISLSPSQSLIT